MRGRPPRPRRPKTAPWSSDRRYRWRVALTLAQFIAANSGKRVGGCGGFPGGQCTALACAWCANLGLATPCGTCGAPDHCDGACWQGSGFAGWTWVAHTPGAIPHPGDIVCYRAGCGADGIGASGHVGIFVSGNAVNFQGFDQNWSGQTAKLVNHGYECVLGWQHPGSIPAPAPAPGTPLPPLVVAGGIGASAVLALLIAGGFVAHSERDQSRRVEGRAALFTRRQPPGGFTVAKSAPARRAAPSAGTFTA